MISEMKNLKIDIEHCYGIKHLECDLDFATCGAYAIYAPNGAMKSSLARTFKDITENVASVDRIFKDRIAKRTIVDEQGNALKPEFVQVVSPYEEVIGHTEKISTLLINAALRHEYEELHSAIDTAIDSFLNEVKSLSRSKKDLRREISLSFTRTEDGFLRALNGVREEVLSQNGAPFATIEYDTVFDDKVVELLSTKDIKALLNQYLQLYGELLDKSPYFSRDKFNYFQGSNVAKSLGDNGFFAANHTITLRADTSLDISDADDLEKLIAQEKENISSDPKLRKKFQDIEKAIHKNANVRKFEEYIAAHPELLPGLADLEKLKPEIWKSYFKEAFSHYDHLVQVYRKAQQRIKEIEDAGRPSALNGKT